jgi:hypothetical protein
MLDWNDTLLEYFSSSNEDEQIVRYFVDRVFIPYKDRNINPQIGWLEVGTGPGTKLRSILENLRFQGLTKRIDLKIIEPSLQWSSHLIQEGTIDRIAQLSNPKIENQTFEEYVQDLKTGNLGFSDLTTIIHVLYSESLLLSTLEYLKLISKSAPFLLFIVVESAESDFAKIRRNLSGLSGDIPIPDMKIILSDIPSKSVRFRQEIIDSQKCIINWNLLGNEEYWLYSFLMGMSKFEFLTLEKSLRDEVMRTTLEYLNLTGKTELTIPDVAFIFENN